jgi:hypothetical protein
LRDGLDKDARLSSDLPVGQAFASRRSTASVVLVKRRTLQREQELLDWFRRKLTWDVTGLAATDPPRAKGYATFGSPDSCGEQIQSARLRQETPARPAKSVAMGHLRNRNKVDAVRRRDCELRTSSVGAPLPARLSPKSVPLIQIKAASTERPLLFRVESRPQRPRQLIGRASA